MAKTKSETEVQETAAATKRIFTAKKAVTLPTLSLKEQGTIAHIRFDSAFFEGKKLANAKEDEKPATLANVRDWDDDDTPEKQLVAPSVLISTLKDNYPDDSYVGMSFEIENLGKKSSKVAGRGAYNTFRIVEIEVSE